MLLINDNWSKSCILPAAVSMMMLAINGPGAEQTTNTETAIEQVETLLKTACGDPKNKSAHCELTEELATRAVALLDHADPFVRGIADWAITIRAGMDITRTITGPAEISLYSEGREYQMRVERTDRTTMLSRNIERSRSRRRR